MTDSRVNIFTDGSCQPNPGIGGYGVIIVAGGERHEFAGGFHHTTNNRMEIMAAIIGLRELPQQSIVTVYTDSQYLCNSIEKGWARKWRSRGWIRQQKPGKPPEIAKNADLWQMLLDLCDSHKMVSFEWVRGHAGHEENERCDFLACQARMGLLQVDTNYLADVQAPLFEEDVKRCPMCGKVSQSAAVVCPYCHRARKAELRKKK